MKHEPRPTAADEGFAMAEGVPIRYLRAGTGPAVVLLHGASSNLTDMSFGLAPPLARDHAVIAFDRPGHGRSGWPARGGERLSEQARLLRLALADLGHSRAILVGHSYGGAVALAWALDAPETVAGLALLGAPSQGWQGDMGLTNELLAHPLAGAFLAYSLPYFVSRATLSRQIAGLFAPQTAPDGLLDHLSVDQIFEPEALRANAVQLRALRSQLVAMAPRYSDLAMPIEILHGTADPLVPFDFMPFLAAQVPGARLSALPGIGHMLQHVAPAEVGAAVARLAAPA